MKTDMKQLKEIIERSGQNVGTISKKIGISRSTFYRKISSGGENFTVGEVHRIAETVPMTFEEVTSVFFC